MPKIAIGNDFLDAFAKLPKAEQKRVRRFTQKFKIDPTMASINYESIPEVRDPKVRTVKIGDTYRAVVIHPPKGDVHLLVWVDHHDEAVAWARNKVFDVNKTTGAIQIVDMQEAESLPEVVAPPDHEPPPESPPSAPAVSKLFDAVSDEELLELGLPSLLMPSVRALETDGQLEKLRPYLPSEVYEALFLVICGASIEDALREVTRPDKVDTDDFTKALEHPDSKRRFRVVETTDELTAMLDAPLEKWRVFLHPMQEKLVKRQFNGPARVLGGAGTGKTVVAMHRARHLAREVFTGPGDRILFTTFTRNLARNIESLLGSLCGPELKRIDVVNLHSWAVRFMRSRDIGFNIAGEAERTECWKDALTVAGSSKWDESFFRDEWDQVVQTNGLSSYQDYRRTPRIGRGTRLSRDDKERVWEVLYEYRQALRDRDLVEWVDVIRRTRQLIEKKEVGLPYKAVVVDEAQDLHPEDWRLLAAIAPEEANNLFIVGDAHQRIYGRKVVLSRLGINIRGRARRLKVNYRTTEEIRRWALALLDGVEIDDLDGGKDTSQGYKSIRNGPEPDVHTFTNAVDEQDFLVKHIGELVAAHPPEEICLVARTRKQVNAYTEVLGDAGIEHIILDKDTDSDEGEGIRLATMHRVKGLEFSHVIVAGLREDAMADAALGERCLVYVSATRAKDGLTVISV